LNCELTLFAWLPMALQNQGYKGLITRDPGEEILPVNPGTCVTMLTSFVSSLVFSLRSTHRHRVVAPTRVRKGSMKGYAFTPYPDPSPRGEGNFRIELPRGISESALSRRPERPQVIWATGRQDVTRVPSPRSPGCPVFTLLFPISSGI
jgi:hypothetical protein